MFDHVDIGNIDILDHEEGRSPHDRRCQLAVGGRCDLDRARLLGRKADPFHQGDGEGAGRDRVGNGRAGNHAGHHRRQNGCFCGAPTQSAEKRDGNFDEPIAPPCPVEQRPEQDEKKDHCCRDTEGNTKDAFGLHPVVTQRLGERGAAIVGDVTRPFGIATKEGK